MRVDKTRYQEGVIVFINLGIAGEFLKELVCRINGDNKAVINQESTVGKELVAILDSARQALGVVKKVQYLATVE
jgi:5,10-methylene-tetrahydrofolate dehydrogenase/methenyl tetrahydrofolate cyclohydrolase